MATLDYNEITIRKYIIIDGEPYEVLEAHIFRMQQRKPQNKAKLRNLISGSVKEMTFHQSEKAEEADISKREIKYLYNNRGEWWFSEISDPSKRFKLEEKLLGNASKFLKANTNVTALIWTDSEEEERMIGVQLPAKVELKVVEAPPAVKGDTAKGGNKVVKLETGATITAPLFVAEGDVIRINTESMEYIERV